MPPPHDKYLGTQSTNTTPSSSQKLGRVGALLLAREREPVAESGDAVVEVEPVSISNPLYGGGGAPGPRARDRKGKRVSPCQCTRRRV